MISVCLRFDDPSPLSDHALEKCIIDILAARGLSACFAVVPYRMDNIGRQVGWTPDLAAHLIEAEKAGVIQIALHGHTHQRVSKSPEGGPSEFFGVPVDEQANCVQKGIEHLQSVFGPVVHGFVPPWNSYDHNTVKVIGEQQLGFLSAGHKILYDDSLPIIPRTCTLRDAAKEIDLALRHPQLDSIVSIVFHPDEFEEFHLPPDEGEAPPYMNLGEFDRFLDRLATNPRLRMTTLATLAEELRPNSRELSQVISYPGLRYLPWRLKRRFPLRLLICGSRWKQLPKLIIAAIRTAG